MNPVVEQILHALKDPSASSAVLPIMLTLGALILLTLLGLYLFAKGAKSQIQSTRFSFKSLWNRKKTQVPKPASPAAPVALSHDPLQVDRLKHALVLLHAQHTRTLIRCSGLEMQVKELERKYAEAKAAFDTNGARIQELEKHADDLEGVLKAINSEVAHFSNNSVMEKSWKLGSKIKELFARLKPSRAPKDPKPSQPDSNLLTLLVGEEAERVDPSATESSVEPAVLSDNKKS